MNERECMGDMMIQKRIIRRLLLLAMIGVMTFLSAHTLEAANNNSNNITVSFNLCYDSDGYQFAKIYGFREGVQEAVWTYLTDYYYISAGNPVIYEIGLKGSKYQFVEDGKKITLDANTGNILSTKKVGEKEKVVDVVDAEYSLPSGKAYTVLVGKSKSGSYVWQYQTGEYNPVQNGNVSYASNKNTVYLFVEGRLYRLNKQSGKIRSKSKKYGDLVAPLMTFDKTGNLYAVDMFAQRLYKFSPKGKEAWHSRNIEKVIGARILADGPEIKTGPDAKKDVYCAFVDWTGADDEDARKVFFDRKTGKIVYHD